MTDFEVHPLGEGEWERYKAIRLRSLEADPEAFARTVEEEQSHPEHFWRERMNRSQRLVAHSGGQDVGLVSVGTSVTGEPRHAEIFGLWVDPSVRGQGVASDLVHAAEREAVAAGKTHLTYWVGDGNGPAVAFASGIGFRPLGERRPMRSDDDSDSTEEVAMILPLET